MIRVLPAEMPHSNSSDGPMSKHNLNTKKLMLPPIQCKWKEREHSDSLSNIGRKITPQTDSNFKMDYIKSSPPPSSSTKPQIRGILKSSLSYEYFQAASPNQLNPSNSDHKRVSFIDEALNKPLAEYDSGDGRKDIDKKKKVCSCITF